jgi:hypothetical protein
MRRNKDGFQAVGESRRPRHVEAMFPCQPRSFVAPRKSREPKTISRASPDAIRRTIHAVTPRYSADGGRYASPRYSRSRSRRSP